MKSLFVKKSSLQGVIEAPPSKSHSLRAILFAALARGTSHISKCLQSPDRVAMIAACRQIGAEIDEARTELVITGVAGHIKTPVKPIDAGNSGIVLRFMAALAATQAQPVVITGDHSICNNRPVKPYIDGFVQLGAECRSLNANDYAPIRVSGPLQSGTMTIDGADSQPVSGLLIASSLVEGTQQIEVLNPGELPWIDFTLWWLDRMKIPYQRQGYQQYCIPGRTVIDAFDFVVPGDYSSAAYPIAAALLTGSTVTVTGLDFDDPQGDKELLQVFMDMGAEIRIDRAQHCVQVLPSPALQGVSVDINRFVDCITLLAVVACFAKTPTVITGAAIARQKECDRIQSIVVELRKMGADIVEHADGMQINPCRLRAATLESYHDHRMVLSLAVAGLAIEGTTVINDIACIAKTYPSFVKEMQRLGANLEQVQ